MLQHIAWRAMAPRAMKPGMKAGAAVSMSGIAAALAATTEVKPALCKKLLETLAEGATKEVKSAGKFTIPGLCMLKTRRSQQPSFTTR